MSILLFCNNLLGAQEGFENDGLYAIFSFKKQSFVYRLSIDDAADPVLRFLAYFGGKMNKNEEDGYTFIQPRAITVDYQIKDHVVAAGLSSWSIPAVEHVLPPLQDSQQLVGALSFWHQRGQLRSDRLLFIYPGSYIAENSSYYHFASLVEGDLQWLKENEEIFLHKLVAQGFAAEQWLQRFAAGELQPLSTAQLWQNYWKEKAPEVSAELSRLERDPFGFYLEKETPSGSTATKAVDGDNVEFRFRISSLDIPLDLQPWQSSVAILGRDNIEPLIAHFLRRIPVGSSWKFLLPPYLQDGDTALWLHYEISVMAIF